MSGINDIFWSLSEAASLSNRISKAVQNTGYIIALYGSVLSGKGNDLDIMAVPWMSQPDRERLIRTICSVSDSVVLKEESGIDGKMAILFLVNSNKKYIDLSVRI